MSNVCKLLHGDHEGGSFLANLDLSGPEKTSLENARSTVRASLRRAFERESQSRFGTTVAPRFFTQGSYAYRTINRPAYPPRQQKDLDDGAYLPLTFMKSGKPSQAAEAYFAFVDSVLESVCDHEGWEFEKRPTCARLVHAKDAHLDIPLYAIPDEQFQTLAKSASAARLFAADSQDFDFMQARMAQIDNWDALPSDQILLAHREEDWKPSDPRKIHEWFLRAVEQHGEQLRRVCRYLKAWRDHHGERTENLSSLCVMVCVFNAYQEVGGRGPGTRDDRALLEIASRLARLLEGPIFNPSDRGEKLCSKLSRDDRQHAIVLAGALATDVKAAIEASEPATSISTLRNSFGTRVPNRPDFVLPDAVTAPAIRSIPPKVVRAPVVGRSVSG